MRMEYPVQIFQRKPTLVQAWKVPMWGKPADEAPPSWLLDRMFSGDIQFNSSGGLTTVADLQQISCGPGDYVMLTEDDTIEFCPIDRFDTRFEAAQAA